MTDHACLACGKIHGDAREVTLHDGRVVSSYSEDWRHHTEARSVLAMPSKLARNEYIAKVADHRGKPAATALRALVKTLWDLKLAKQRAAS